MYKIESSKLLATRYYTTYSAAKADCKVYGIKPSCIKPVH